MTTRRQFIRRSMQTVGGLAAMALPGAAVAAAEDAGGDDGQPRRWRTAFGLNGFMSSAHRYGKKFPISKVLDFAQEEGFDGIELVNGWPEGAYPAAEQKAAIARLKEPYSRRGLQVFSIQTNAGGAFRKSPAARKRWLHTFAQRAGFARQIGCDCIGLWPGGGLDGQTLDQAIDNLVESLKEVAKIADSEGLQASIEIEPPFVFKTIDVLIKIVERVANPSLKAMYDPSHFDLMNGGKGKPEELLERLGVENVGYVHLTDSDGTKFGGTSRHLPCGDGHIDIRRSLEMLWKGGYEGWLMIDAWLIEDPFDACRKGKTAIDDAMEHFLAGR